MTIDVSIIPVQRQTTLGAPASCEGVALHDGRHVHMIMKPAPVGTGIVFIRTDVFDRENEIAVRADAVTDVKRCTTISNYAGITVSTIEHLMAALSAFGLDNLYIEIDGPELPALDGSSEHFLHVIETAGLVSQSAPRRYIKVLKSVEVHVGEAYARIDPSHNLYLDVTIDFAEAAIGHQRIEIEPDVKAFRKRLASARTFARSHEVAALMEAGLSLGGSYDNAIVVDGDKVLNPGGLRYSDEFVRHKALDLLGDMYVGGPLLGRVTTVRAGHALNHQLLVALFADPQAWKYTHIASPAELKTNRTNSMPIGVSALEETVSAL